MVLLLVFSMRYICCLSLSSGLSVLFLFLRKCCFCRVLVPEGDCTCFMAVAASGDKSEVSQE